jgi:hypothetical protein
MASWRLDESCDILIKIAKIVSTLLLSAQYLTFLSGAITVVYVRPKHVALNIILKYIITYCVVFDGSPLSY